jgi:hypothetical protein
MFSRALLALKLGEGTKELQKLYLDQLKVLKKSYFKLSLFQISYIWLQSRYYGRGRFWELSTFWHLYKIWNFS